MSSEEEIRRKIMNGELGAADLDPEAAEREEARRILDGHVPDLAPKEKAGDDMDDVAQKILDGEITTDDATVNSDIGSRIMKSRRESTPDEQAALQAILNGGKPPE
eukprot:m.322042 g.322042  ORF g.322042 m.322042 type:complete len:106 (-) comp26278_c0_seq1:19-336(-)